MSATSGWAWVAVSLLATGCVRAGVAIPAPAEEPFRIGREDVLEVAVWRDVDLSRVLAVRPDGCISLPMVGDVRAEGLTPGELAGQIESQLAYFVLEPKVTVNVREVNSSRVFVTGEVARPGSYPLRGRVTLVQAVALAGGFTAFADPDGLVLLRPGAGGGRFRVRFSDLVSADVLSRADVPLRSGDTVLVP